MDDLPEEFAAELAQLLSRFITFITCHLLIFIVSYRPLQQLFQDEAKQLLAEQTEGEAGVQRKRHSALSQQVQELWNRARLFEKGAQKFEGMRTRIFVKLFAIHCQLRQTILDNKRSLIFVSSPPPPWQGKVLTHILFPPL